MSVKILALNKLFVYLATTVKIFAAKALKHKAKVKLITMCPLVMIPYSLDAQVGIFNNSNRFTVS